MGYSSKHLNGNLLAAIDLETSGLIAGKHDILQICIMPLGPDLKPSRIHPLFHMKLCPKRPDSADGEALKVNKLSIADCIANGTDPWSAVERLGEWFERLRLPMKKKIIPLGCNFAGIDKSFILDWLGGPLSYEEYFRSDHRDIMTAALFMNDQAEMLQEPIPFPKYNLSYIASTLGVETVDAHDAVGDCIRTAECYRRILTYRQYHRMYQQAGKEITIEFKGDHAIVKNDSNPTRIDNNFPNLCYLVGDKSVEVR